MSTAARPLWGCRALIVEDDGLFALAMTEMLADLGCIIVDVAPGLARALASAEFHELDLAVVDVNLGDEKAFRVAHMLMAREVPFLFATGAGRDAIPAAFDDVPALAKPFTAAQLATALVALVPRDIDRPRPRGNAPDAKSVRY
ncbi:response regulator [Phenylobacterium sp.]|uniref:response regulator n=1 Tax=Phenylobacterium sp. TaxID=1871053 RepID=UPI003D2E7544